MASHVDATGYIPPSSGGGLVELLYFFLIFDDVGPRRIPSICDGGAYGAAASTKV